MQKETSTMNPLLAFVAGGLLVGLGFMLYANLSKKEVSLEDQFHEAMEQERYTDAHKIHCKMTEQNPSIKDLKNLMNKAVETEEYEIAAKYRDAINNRLQKKPVNIKAK